MPSATNLKRAAQQQYWHESGFTGIYTRATLRTLQFFSSIILLGIYGSDLSVFPSTSLVSSTNWIFAIVVAVLSALTCVLHCFLTIKRVAWIFWDFVLAVLFAALAGSFGTTYLGTVNEEDRRATASVSKMRAGVAFALLGMVLWFATWILGLGWCCAARRITRKTDVDNEEQGLQMQALSKVDEE